MRTLLARSPIPPLQALSVAAQLAAALRERDRAGLGAHRQLSPDCVEVTWDTDRPLVTLKRPEATADPAYLAPEQWSGGEVGLPADVFATTALLFHLLTGAAPPRAGDLPLAGLPPTVQSVVRAGLRPQPADRIPDGAGLFEALSRAHQALADAETGHRVRRVVLVGLAALLLGTVGLGLSWGRLFDLGEGSPLTAQIELEDTGRAPLGPGDPTGRVVVAPGPEDTGRVAGSTTVTGHSSTREADATKRSAAVSAAGETGRADEHPGQETGRELAATPADSGRSQGQHADPTGRTGAIEPGDTGRATGSDPAETGREETVALLPKEPPRQSTTGRDDTTDPSQTGRDDTTDPPQTGRDDTTDPSQTGRDDTTDPPQTGRDDTTDPPQTGRDDTTDPSQTGRDDTPDPSQTGRDDTTDPSQTGREDTADPSQTGREDTADSSQTGREDTASPTETGRTDGADPTQTGRTIDAAPLDTGRVDPVAGPSPSEAPRPASEDAHVLPDGAQVELLVISGGPVVLESGGRVHVAAFRIQAEATPLKRYVAFLEQRLAAGQPIGRLLPADPQGREVQRHLARGMPLTAGPLLGLSPQADAAFQEWCGLRALDPYQRLRAAKVAGISLDDVRGGALLR